MEQVGLTGGGGARDGIPITHFPQQLMCCSDRTGDTNVSTRVLLWSLCPQVDSRQFSRSCRVLRRDEGDLQRRRTASKARRTENCFSFGYAETSSTPKCSDVVARRIHYPESTVARCASPEVCSPRFIRSECRILLSNYLAYFS